MTLLGPALDGEVAELVEAVAAAVGSVTDVRTALIAGGWWTVGVDAASGGGGADDAQTALVLATVARRSASAAWLSVQAHLGGELLAGRPEARAVHAGETAFAAVRRDSASCGFADGVVAGELARVESATTHPMIGLMDPTGVWLLDPAAITDTRVLARSGLAETGAAAVVVRGEEGISAHRLEADTASLLRRRHLGAAAVATGLAWEAAERAAAYVRQRHQFGGPLVALPAVREGERVRAAGIDRMLRALLGAGGTDRRGAAHLAVETLNAAIDVIDSALLAHGGYGYLQEYAVERLLRDAVSLRAAIDTAAARADVA